MTHDIPFSLSLALSLSLSLSLSFHSFLSFIPLPSKPFSRRYFANAGGFSTSREERTREFEKKMFSRHILLPRGFPPLSQFIPNLSPRNTILRIFIVSQAHRFLSPLPFFLTLKNIFNHYRSRNKITKDNR